MLRQMVDSRWRACRKNGTGDSPPKLNTKCYGTCSGSKRTNFECKPGRRDVLDNNICLVFSTSRTKNPTNRHVFSYMCSASSGNFSSHVPSLCRLAISSCFTVSLFSLFWSSSTASRCAAPQPYSLDCDRRCTHQKNVGSVINAASDSPQREQRQRQRNIDNEQNSATIRSNTSQLLMVAAFHSALQTNTTSSTRSTNQFENMTSDSPP